MATLVPPQALALNIQSQLQVSKLHCHCSATYVKKVKRCNPQIHNACQMAQAAQASDPQPALLLKL